jgi:hypothetical protein
MVRGDRIIFAELKSPVGKLSLEQEKWIIALRLAGESNPGVDTYVWKPEDWRTIEGCLAR